LASFVDLRFNHHSLEEAVDHLPSEAGMRGLGHRTEQCILIVAHRVLDELAALVVP
jgi:hypothetical protein